MKLERTAISVELDVNADTEQQAKRQFIGIMRFNYVPSIGLSKTQIDQRFVGYTIHPTFVPMENGFTVTLNGKSGSKIAAFYSVRNFDDHVSDFVISQRP